MRKFSIPVAMLMSVGLTVSAQAYVGPGAGLSLLGALWALLIAVFAAVGFIFAWPVRKWLRKRKARKTASQKANENHQAPGA